MNPQSEQEPALEESRARSGEQLAAGPGAHCSARWKLARPIEEEAAGVVHLLQPLLVLLFFL